jgi:hypothetical protein
VNWTRGLFRLWLLVSIPWIVYVVATEWSAAASSCESARYSALNPQPPGQSEFLRFLGEEDRPPLTPAEAYALGEQMCRMDFHAATKNIAIQTSLVPVGLILGAAVLFIVGAALVWGVRGFQRTNVATPL